MDVNRRILIAVVVGLVLVAAGGAVALTWPRPQRAQATTGRVPGVATTVVRRQSISVRDAIPASLRYGSPRPVALARTGVITWLPSPGVHLRPGNVVARVDDEPVVLMAGGLPLYRELDTLGEVGRDVREVVSNLEAWGFPVDDEPAPGTTVMAPLDGSGQTGETGQGAASGAAAPSAAPSTYPVVLGAGQAVVTRGFLDAVAEWRRSLGMVPQGGVGPGDVVVEPGPVRVASLPAAPGDASPTTALTVTDTTPFIAADLDPGEAADLRVGQRVTVVRADSSTLAGRIAGIGTAPADPSDPGGSPQAELRIALRGRSAGVRRGALDGDLQVRVPTVTRKDVLVVPVDALLALAGGGYALQLPSGALVRVRTGIFSDGLVQVRGRLRAGERVVTTS